ERARTSWRDGWRGGSSSADLLTRGSSSGCSGARRIRRMARGLGAAVRLIVMCAAAAALPLGLQGATAAAPVLAATCHSNGVLPNSTCQPGATNPDVTQSTIGQTICVSGWTQTVRPPTSYTNPLKVQQ